MFCQTCGGQLTGAFCGHCGSQASGGVLVSSAQANANILHNIKGNAKLGTVELTCLECGYRGLMGVVRRTKPWWATWYVMLPLCLTGIGLVVMLFYGILAGSATKNVVMCPACGRELIQQ